jgi:heavy metal translocating P-type ATPase
VLLVASVAALATGAVAALTGHAALADAVWGATTAVGAVGASIMLWRTLRAGHLGVDVVAVLAMVGSLVAGEQLAGALIAVMLATGRTLEARAARRAQKELTALIERAPHVAHRVAGDGSVADVAVDDVAPGDVLVVKPGDVVPVDGVLAQDAAVIDESTLTGEALPVERASGDPVRSGSVNAGAALTMVASTRAADSTYAGIVRMVSDAQASNAPFVRLADRYAAVFVVATLVTAALAWLVSGELVRAVAVLVTATPCPLILAAPVAIVSGLSRAARDGVIVKDGAALERLAGAVVLLFDKTGTLTVGRPSVADVVVAGSSSGSELLRMAASLDQLSPHVLAGAVVRAARDRHFAIERPSDVREVAGCGIEGKVGARTVALGKAAWVAPGSDPSWSLGARRRADLDGALTIFVAVDGEPAGAILLHDPVRPDARRTIRSLRRSGIRRVVMVTGDRTDAAEAVGAVIGVDEVVAECSPAEKVDAVRRERRHGATVMVGDGINDAPALAAADVGVAMGARGVTASSQAADVVLVVDRLERLGQALVTSRRTRRIARQSALVGIGLSIIAMIAAAFGALPPAWGALVQEAIDVAVVLNALRPLAGDRPHRLDAAGAATTRRFAAEHRELGPGIEQLRKAADGLGAEPADRAMAAVRSARTFLDEEIAPHERSEDAVLYPVIAKVLGGEDPTGAMSRAHGEIAHQIRRFGRAVDAVGADGPDDTQVTDLRRLLYGLYAILLLHFAQEDEGYLSLDDGDGDDRSPPP